MTKTSTMPITDGKQNTFFHSKVIKRRHDSRLWNVNVDNLIKTAQTGRHFSPYAPTHSTLAQAPLYFYIRNREIRNDIAQSPTPYHIRNVYLIGFGFGLLFSILFQHFRCVTNPLEICFLWMRCRRMSMKFFNFGTSTLLGGKLILSQFYVRKIREMIEINEWNRKNWYLRFSSKWTTYTAWLAFRMLSFAMVNSILGTLKFCIFFIVNKTKNFFNMCNRFMCIANIQRKEKPDFNPWFPSFVSTNPTCRKPEWHSRNMATELFTPLKKPKMVSSIYHFQKNMPIQIQYCGPVSSIYPQRMVLVWLEWILIR